MMAMMASGGGGGGGPITPNDSLSLDFVYQGQPFSFISEGTPAPDGLDQVYAGEPYAVEFF